MKRFVRGVLGIALVVGCFTFVAARYEELVVGKLRAERAVVCESTVAVTGAATMNGGLTVSGAINQSGGVSTKTAVATTTTNGSEITISAPVHILTGTGMLDNHTNIVTVVNPAQYTEVLFIVSATSTNLVRFEDSGNLALSGAAVLDNNDTLGLYFTATDNGVETSQVDN